METHQDSTPFLERGDAFIASSAFLWPGHGYLVFIQVISLCARLLSSLGHSLGISAFKFGSPVASEALRAAQILICVLLRFGSTLGTTADDQIPQALESGHCGQFYPDVLRPGGHCPSSEYWSLRLGTGPPMAPVRSVARLKGLLTATAVAVGLATRVHPAPLSRCSTLGLLLTARVSTGCVQAGGGSASARCSSPASCWGRCA